MLIAPAVLDLHNLKCRIFFEIKVLFGFWLQQEVVLVVFGVFHPNYLGHAKSQSKIKKENKKNHFGLHLVVFGWYHVCTTMCFIWLYHGLTIVYLVVFDVNCPGSARST